MRARLFLAGAIVTEASATLSLRAAVDHPGWLVLVVVGYAAAFGMLGLVLREGMSVGAAYGIWGAAGVALVAVLGSLLFTEALSGRAIIGIAVIIAGVLLVETGGRRDREAPADGADARGSEGRA